jgi:dipeptidyl aminopeptidase/acylaminoacyl peptidase
MSRLALARLACCLAPLLLTPAADASHPQSASQPLNRPLTVDDLSKLRTVSDPQVSPDGRWVAYVVGTQDVEKDKRDSDLWMVSWDGKEQVRLTASADTTERAPRWSPDGRYLAFLSARGDEAEKKKGAQVWLLDRQGGEAQKLTDIKGGISDVAWSPDGRRLCLVVNDFDPSSDPEKLEDWKRKTAPPIVIDRYHFKSDQGGYLRRLHTHLTLFEVDTKKADVLTRGMFDDQSPAWSPDGKSIAFVSNRTPDPDRNDDTNIYVVEARAGAAAKVLTTFEGRDGGMPAWSPDGTHVAYVQGDETKLTAYHLDKLAVVPAAGGPARVLTASLDRPVDGRLAWAPDGRSIRVVVSDDRTAYAAGVAVASGAVEKLTTGERAASAVSPRAGGGLALLVSAAAQPDEVYALENGALRQLSHQNDALMAGLQLAATEGFSCKAKDGTVVNGIVRKPAGFVAGKKYPTLLIIHGGPNGQDEYSFDFTREFFAAHGYVVLAVNYRGSSGRGGAFQKAIFADWGNKEVVDLLAAADWAVASGIADPEKLGIGGWSYGGILTDYTIASDPRFKAAVSGASSALQMSLYGVDQYIVQWDLELGPPWKAADLYARLSYPFLHADRIKTPTLFMCGQVDFNVPVAGVEQMYQALKSLGVETGLVIYPDQHHSLSVPSYQRDRLTRWLGWYDRFLKPAATVAPGQ